MCVSYLKKSKRVPDSLKETSSLGANSVETPMVSSIKLFVDDADVNYHTVTSTDIAIGFFDSMVNKFMSSSVTTHLEVIFHVWRNLKGASGCDVWYRDMDMLHLRASLILIGLDPLILGDPLMATIHVGGNLVS